MKTPPTPHPAIVLINAKIEEHRELAADFAADRTLELAESALNSAKAAAAKAELEDDSIDPEALVDKRMDARRAVEVAEIRLARAKKAIESRGWDVQAPLHAGGKIAAEALREVADPFGNQLEAALRNLIGDDYNTDSGHYKSLIYRKKERLFGHARSCEQSASVQVLERAIAMIEDATRLG
jgi:hypothetical protein